MTPSEAQNLIRSTYRQYLGREPGASDFAIHMKWTGNPQDWVRTIQNSPEAKAYAARTAPAKPGPAPSAPGPAPKDPDFSGVKTFKGGGGSEGGDFGTPEERAQNDRIRGEALKNAKLIPGATPYLGVLPSGTIIDLRTGLPPTGNVSDIDRAYAKLALRLPGVPSYDDVKKDIKLSGRGYEYKGKPSAEEQALGQRLLSGDVTAAGPLADMRMKRLQVPERGWVDKIMRPLTLAGVSVGLGALGGAAAAPLGLGAFGGGALAGGIGSTTGQALAGQNLDWRKILASTASGGLGAGVGGATSGLGNFTSGALGGAASAGANVGLTAALGGQANPWDILVSAASGGLAKGLTGAALAGKTKIGTDPGGIGSFEIPPEGLDALLIKMFGGLGAKGSADLLRSLIPGADTPSGFETETAGGSPFAPKEAMDKMRAAAAQAREIEQRDALQRAVQEFEGKRAEFEARKAEALGNAERRRDEQMAEFNLRAGEARQKASDSATARAEALERLRQQALAYMERAQSARNAPLPPIPVPQGPAPLAPPDPFDPSAALSGQSFGGDFPTTQGAGSFDFPVSQEAPAAPSSAPPTVKKANLQQLPLNLQQIQAALAARRR